MNLKVGAASLNQTPLDWDRNKANISEALRLAREQKVQVLCLPELSITGYGCEDHFLSEEVRATAADILQSLLPETIGMFTCFGIPMLWCSALYNVMVCVYDGEVVGIVPKQHLAGDGLHYEPRWFKPWPAGMVTRVACGDDANCEGHSVGDLIFQIGQVRIGFEICEDAFVAERPGNSLARRGVDIIMNPSASHFAFGKSVTRERLVVEGSRAFNVTYIYANLLGNEAGRAIYDGDCIIASCGDTLERGPFLSMKRVSLTTAVVDLSKAKTKIVGTASFSPNLEECYKGVVTIPTDQGFEPSNEKVTGPLDLPKSYKCQEFTDAITLGLWDYLVKSHSKGYVISLSGGADSAACAVLVRHMITRAVDAFGFHAVCAEFGIPFLAIDGAHPVSNGVSNTQELVGELLTCVYQSTSNSSETTLNAAKAVAAELGAKFCKIDIESVVQQYTALAEAVEGRKLSWETDDLALQNIQARARAPSIWMVANIEGKLLITTSNRSEAAVGYCTMDGDTAGSIAPIGGIDKAFILNWLHHMREKYPSLDLIIKQRPTAELRPGQGQTDEEDLMPYEILDAIETWAILEKKGPKEVFECLCRENHFGTQPYPKIAAGYVRKFFTLWVRNQWKRERYAISFHVDSHNLDPKTWCRFPVLSGGFAKELEELEKSCS